MGMRTACGGCGNTELYTFLDLGKSPLAGDFVTPDSTPQLWLPLSLGVCPNCWLVQQMYIVEDEDIFNDTYPATAGLDTWDNHALATLLISRHQEQLARGPVVEIGVNDGDLLQHFHAYKTIGVDPAGVATRNTLLNVINERFNLTLARKIRNTEGEAGLVIARHVVDRVIDLDDFFAGLDALVSPFGLVIIETSYLGATLMGNHFGDVMHERRYHFSLTTISAIAERYGLFVENVELSGHNMRLTLGRNGPSFGVVELRRGETWMAQRETYEGVQGRVEFIKNRIVEFVERERTSGRRVAAYGATNEGMTLLLYCGLNANKIEYVVDPTRGDRLNTSTPGFYIPVIAPGEWPKPDTYLILDWHHIGQLLRAGASYLAEGGRFIVPLPDPMII